MSEFAGAIERFPEYTDPLIAVFTNGLSDISPDVPEPPAAITEAEASVTASLQINGSPESIYAGQRAEIKQFFATAAGVSLDAVLLTFMRSSSERRNRRQLLA